eukprot:642970_1
MSCFACFSKSSNSDVSKITDSKAKKTSTPDTPKERAIRILLLGPGSSGKTTIVKQIKKIHHHDETHEEHNMQQTAKYIKESVITNIKILCEESVLLNHKHQLDTLVHPDNECLRHELTELESPYELTQDLAFKVRVLWTDKGIQNTLNHRQYFQIAENASYFFDQVEAIASPNYNPSFDDYVRFRQITTGLSQTQIKINFGCNFGDQVFEFTDVGGQKSERHKVKHAKDDANAVIYVVGLSDYDLTLYEDNTTNRLTESIDMFRDVMLNHKLYVGRTVLLFFNKYDLFKEKIKKVPITVALDDFPEESDPNDANDVIRFVADKFLNVFRDAKVHLSGPLHIVRTTALDTDMIDKVFSDVTMDLLKRNLETMDLI